MARNFKSTASTLAREKSVRVTLSRTYFPKLRACAAWAIYAALTKLQSNFDGDVQISTFTATLGLYATVANARASYVAGANAQDIFIKNESPIRKRGTIKMSDIKISDYFFAVLPILFALFIIGLLLLIVRPLLG